MSDEWLTVSEVSKISGVSRQALHARIKRNTMEGRSITVNGRKVVFCRVSDARKAGGKGGRPRGHRTDADRKEAEKQRRSRARMYWRKRILYDQDMPSLLSGISETVIEQERVKYLSEMAETVEVETVEASEAHGN